MLTEIGIDMFDFMALLSYMGMVLGIGISITDGVGMVCMVCSGYWHHLSI
jgi:hypothetical protein